MMGKLHSKHADCIFVNADLNKALEDSIWKKKTGFNLANYNMDETLSELSICLEEKSESSSSPLRVDLPPPKLDTETSKVLRLDHIGIRRAGRHHGLQDKTKINIEDLQELECGVHLEGSDSAKHEWSFTLYDFDGHGRITKEDLSSLLKALYDAVGSSIKLPPNGAKTLKLRLSVGQDGGPASLHQMTQGQGEDAGCSGVNNNSNNNQSGKNNFNNATSTTKNNIVSGAAFAARVSERARNTARAPKNKVREFSKVNNLTRAAASEQKQQMPQVVKRTNEHRGQQARISALTSAVQLAPPPSVCSAARDSGLFVPAPLTAEVSNNVPEEPAQPAEPQSNSKQGAEAAADGQAQVATAHALSDHQRLANLVQENMERNKVRQQLRRLGEHRTDGHHRSQHYHNNHHHPHHNYHSRHHKRRQHRTAAPPGTTASHCHVPSSRPAGGDLEENTAGVKPLDPPTVSQWWAGRKPTSKVLHEAGADREEDEESQGCSKTCGLIGQCRERGKSSETKDRRVLVALQEGVKDDTKRESEKSRLQEERAEESQDRRNYYLDLAGVENTSSRFQSNHHSHSPINRAGCSRRYRKGHHRSRSQDLATAHVSMGADVKFSNVISGKGLDAQCSAPNDFGKASGLNDCVWKRNSSNKCDNLLFSAVAFGLSLASERNPQLREKCDKTTGSKTEHITVGNSVVHMLATTSRTESLEHQRHGRSKSFDPQDATGGSGESGKRARRNQKLFKQCGDQQLPTCHNRPGPAVASLEDTVPTSSTKLNPLNFPVHSGSSTTTTTTDNNNVSSSNNPRSRRFRPLSLPGHVPACVSPHYHRRHRHRDKDHSQAMQQVAQWIEREQHAWDQDTGGAAAAATSGDHIVVQRHEHHHIHEHHHHHHYHHYHET